MTDFKLTYHRFSERSILVQWPQKIDKSILDDVLIFKRHLQNLDTKQILQINNAYNSILIIYLTTIENINDSFLMLKKEYSVRQKLLNSENRHWKIPVCYDQEFGLDLIEISEEKDISISQLIQLHSEAIYTVYFIGFLPGFLYLGGLDELLYFPRKKSPRQRIEKGAVAIGGSQTGIYPNASPAGWNVIGNSPLEFFNIKSEQPCFAQAGDTVQFIKIEIKEHAKISESIKKGDFKMENSSAHG